MAFASTATFRREVEAALPRRPFGLRFWDGTGVEATESDAPTFTFRSPQALAHVVRAPGELGIGRAYVSGLLEVDDIDKALRVVDTFDPPPLGVRRGLRLAGGLLAACGLTRLPRPPAAELRLRGERHTLARDRRAVRHHYDVGNEFFALFLDESMTYSCACFFRGATTLEEAQEAKLEMVCTKLELREGERVLDVGCGWGSFVRHAATRHGAHVVGITLSEPQARLARERAAEAGAADRVDIRVADYRELRDERFDAIASIGMVEHVGEERIDLYARQLARLLVPGGRLLNHGIAKLFEVRHPRRGPVLGAVRLPRRRPPAPVAGHASAGTCRVRAPAHRGDGRRLRADPHPLDRALRVLLRSGRAAGRSGAGAGVAPVPARRPPGFPHRRGFDLSGARAPSVNERSELPLSELTTLRLGGPARRVVNAVDEREIVETVRAADEREEPLLVIGAGSNLVVSDEGFDGTVLRVATRGVSLGGSVGAAFLSVAAGELWDDLVGRIVGAGISGVECLSGIPGLTGATPIQNVGAYGQEVAQTIASVRVYDRRDRAVRALTPEQCGFGYRSSAFRHSTRYIVLAVGFALERSGESQPVAYPELAKALAIQVGERAPLSDVREAVIALRRRKGMVLDPDDPDSVSAGSFFLNPLLTPEEFAAFQTRVRERLGAEVQAPAWPQGEDQVKVSAAWLIERAGFSRGYRSGRAGISSKHTLALINRGQASTAELLGLARELRDGVHRAFGVTLTPEPTLVGVEL